jgi:hypothetical protein
LVTQEDSAERLRKCAFKATGAYIRQIEFGFRNMPYGLAGAICEKLGFDCHQDTENFFAPIFNW